MNKVILLGASWCPVTKNTKELFGQLKIERPDFDYKYIDIDSDKGKELVKKFFITDVPKTIYQDKIIFHGLPLKEELIKLMK